MKHNSVAYMTWACLMAAAVLTGGCALHAGGQASGGRQMTLEVSHIGDTLDPVQGGNGALLTRLGVGETLVRRNSEMDLAGDLADSWKQTGTNEWTFHIKDHVKFQNGDDLTGERVKESLERAVHDNKRDRTLSDIRSVRAEGQDVVIQTGKASGSLPVVLSDPAFVILDVRGNSSDSSAVPVGTGPYEVTQFAKDQGITLKGDSRYRGGQPGLDTLTVKAVADNAQRIQDLKEGRADAVLGIDAADWSGLKNDSRYQMYSEDSMRADFLQLNLKGVLQNEFLRRAVSRAIQYSRLAEQAGNGSDPAGELLTPLFKEEADAQYKESTNLTEAAGYLVDAGYMTKNTEGWAVDKDGRTVTLKLGTTKQTAEADEQIREQLKAAGIQVELVPVPEGQKEISMEGLDMIHSGVLSLGGLSREPSLMMEDLFRTGAPGNRGGYSSAAVDQWLDELRGEGDRSRRLALMNQIQNQILQDVPDIFLIFPARTAAVSERVQNFSLPPDGDYLVTKDLTVQ